MNFLKPRDECGSVLVGGLVLVFVITLVGLAVFDLSLSEPRLFADRQNKAQAVYTADAGLNVAWNEMANGATNTFATVWGNLAGTNIVPTGGGTHLLTAASGGYQRNYQVQKCSALYPAACDAAGGLPATNFVVRSTGSVVRTADNATSQAIVEFIFNRSVDSIFKNGVMVDQNATVDGATGNPGTVDSWDSSVANPPSCTTPPCPYSAATAGKGGGIFSNGTLLFKHNDLINGNVTAVGDITVDSAATLAIKGSVTSGGNVSGGASVPAFTVGTSTSPTGITATGNIGGYGTIYGPAVAGGTISANEVDPNKFPTTSPAPARPTPIVFPPVAPCNQSSPTPALGQYTAGDPNRAASGYSKFSYVASKLTSSTCTLGTGGSCVYNETTGALTVSSNTMTIKSGSDPSVGTFCFSSITLSGGGGMLAVNSASDTVPGEVTSAQPITMYLTGTSHSDFTGGGFTNNTFDSSRLQIYSAATTSNPTNGPITISGGSTAYLTIYAPQTSVTISGGGSALYGSVVAKTFSGTGGSDVHYDKNLGNADNIANGLPAYKVVPNTWRATVVQ